MRSAISAPDVATRRSAPSFRVLGVSLFNSLSRTSWLPGWLLSTPFSWATSTGVTLVTGTAIVNGSAADAAIDVMLFPKAYASVAMTLATDTMVSVKGRVRAREDGVEITGSTVSVINVSASAAEPLTIAVPVTRVTPVLVAQLKGVLNNHPGSQEVRLRLLNSDTPKTLKLGADLRVATSGALMADLKALLGPSCVA